MKIWKTYDNTYGYVDEKIGRIKDLENIEDNFMSIFAMFDSENQMRVRSILKETTLKELQERLV